MSVEALRQKYFPSFRMVDSSMLSFLKGAFQNFLRKFVFVILNDRTELLGAALVAARQAGYHFEEPPIMEIIY